MKQRMKMTTAILVILALFVLGGCAGSPAPSATATPTPTPTGSYIYEPEPAASPVLLPAGYYSTTNEIPPETEMAVFDYASQDEDPYNVKFSGRTSVDLDGDGQADTIELLPGQLNADANPDFKLYDSIIVKVNGQATTVDAPAGKTICEDYEAEGRLYGFIMDVDKNDGKKEIVIDDSDPNFPVSCMLTYDGKKTTLIPWLKDAISATGTGYIYVYDWIGAGELAQADGMGILRLKKLSAGRTGWEDVKVKYYRTVSTYLPPIDEYTPSADSQSDQMLAKAPGGAEEVPVQAGTEVFLGFYDPAGWIQVIRRDGTILGWLNCKKVSWDEYTDYVYAPDLG